MISHTSKLHTTIASIIVAALALPLQAQTTLYSQNFENMGNVPIGGWGPQGLINQGWIFRNQSSPLGPVAWVSGCCWAGIIDPLSGTGYLAAYQDSAAGSPAQYNAWAIVPAVPDQQAGDILTIYTSSSDTYWWISAHLEVRYSSTGGTSTGNTSTSVGDFTTTLLSVSPMPNYNEGLYNGWTKWEVALPGPGRIALRQMGIESLYFGVEDLSVVRPGGGTPQALPENFEDLAGICGEGPCRLIDQGWIFRDQGSFAAGAAWEPNLPLDPYTPHSGFGFMRSFKGGGGNDGSINAWAILPDVNSHAGDVLSFFVRGSLGIGGGGSFQVRYSPSGGTSTGSSPTDVGDFNQMLLEMTELPSEGWQHILITLPGPGRIALRSVDDYQPFFDPAVIVAIDSMSLNPPSSAVPVPQPGQTVNWGLAGSPYNINTDLHIPVGGTVNVEPGVSVNLAAECTLSIGGTVNANGATIQSVGNYPPGVIVIGTFDAQSTTINTQVQPNNGGSLLFDQCTFNGPNGLISNISAPILDSDDKPPFLSITRCTFNDADVMPADATVLLTNSTFNDAMVWFNRDYVLVDQLTFDGGSLTIGRDQQNVYINNITVQNSPGPGIHVWGDNIGNDYLFGPNNVLTGNQYPAAAEGGILPGSVLPQSGNAINAVLLEPLGFEMRGPSNFGDPGIPYHGPDDLFPYLVGEFNLYEGVVWKFPAGLGIGESNNLVTRGTPENPVRFEGLNGQWYGIYTPTRMEYTVIDGSQWGVINAAVGLPGFYDSCTFSNNARAMVGGGIVRKSRFINNSVGANVGFTMDLNGQTNPNSFIGNGLAVQAASDALYNWWGHPTGPSGPQNPGGQGDPVSDGVSVSPFRTTEPVSDLVNHPPIVRMEQLYFAVSAGATVIVHWSTTDADAVSHRVLMSTQFDVPSQYVVVADGLSASARSYALTAPGTNGIFYVRVEAVDEIGQVGWDRKQCSVQTLVHDPDLVAPPSPPATRFVLGHPIPLDPSVNYLDTGYVLLDGQMLVESFGAAGVLPTTVTASSDTTRVLLQTSEGPWKLSNYFTVRPDERLGDQAPTVQLNSPNGGSFPGGAIVPISWTASDDESIAYVTIQASYDGGLTFHNVAKRLPGSQTSFNWKLPSLTQTISNVKVRVAVEDLRFQMSSATSAAITFNSGSGSGQVADINGDGVVNVTDLLAVINGWGMCPAPPQSCLADVNSDGVVNVLDLLAVITNWG